MKEEKIKKERRVKRQKRSRAKVLIESRTGLRPRLSVFKSNRYFYAQIIDDMKGITLVGVSEKEIGKKEKMSKSDKTTELAKIITEKAKKIGIKKVVFDKGMYKYHGNVKNFADAVRKEGLIF